jgi:nucleoside-diphosphate-sugar epimerase
MRHWLLIGGKGTIGTALQAHLTKVNEPFTVVDIEECNVLVESLVERVVRENIPTHVVHLAAWVGRVHNEEYQRMALNVNVIGTYNVIQACLKHKVKMVHISTSETYGLRFNEPHTRPAIEIHAVDDYPFYNGIYGQSKMMGEKLVWHYWRNYALNYSMVRPFMCYSPINNQSNNATCISKMVDAALHDEPIMAHTDTSRSWCYHTDMAEGIYLAGVQGNRLYNIGNPYEAVSSIKLANIIREMCRSGSEIITGPPPDDIFKHKHFSIRLAEDELYFRPKVILEDGLQEVIDARK